MTKLSVRVIPNASKNEVAGKDGGTWRIRLAAPPVDGKANDALIEFLSDVLDLPKSDISIIKGHASKQKILDIPLAPTDIEVALSSH